MALPSNVSYGTVVGKFIRAVGAGSTPGSGDTGVPLDGLSVEFSPSTTVFRNQTASTPVTILADPIKATTNAQGVLVGPNGDPGVELIATDDPDLTPAGWTWNVRIAGPGVVSRFAFLLPGDTTVDLASVIPVPSNPGADIRDWVVVRDAALAAKDTATVAAATATQAASDAVAAKTAAEAVGTTNDAVMAAAVGSGGAFDTKLSATIGEQVEAAVANIPKGAGGFRPWTPVYKDTFGALSRWSVADGASIADDPDNFRVYGVDIREDGATVQTTGTAIKVTKTATASSHARIDCNLAVPLDVSDHHPLLKYYIHPGSGMTSSDSLGSVTLMLYDAAGGFAYWSDTGMGLDIGGRWFQPGWRTKPFRALDYNATHSNGFDAKNVTRIRIWVRTKSGQDAYTPSITLDSLEFIPKLAPPVPYVLTFDGGYTEHKKALAFLSAKGIRAHLYPTFDMLGEPGRMSLADLRQAEQQGHIVGFHERAEQPTGFYTLTDAEKVASVQDGLDWMAANGFRSGAGFAPLATRWWQDGDSDLLLYPMLEHVRIGQEQNQVLWNPRIIGLAYDTNSLTVPDEAAARQRAVERGSIYGGCVHDLKGSFTLEDFKTIINAAEADPGVEFVTVPELMTTDWYHR